MNFDELTFVCQQAALDLVEQNERPLPPAIVLPAEAKSRIVVLPEFPADDEQRHAYLAEFARTEITEAKIPAWGFLAEAEMDGHDVLVLVHGARRNVPHITAAKFTDDGLDTFLPSEELDPSAMPFLHPLQHAVDALPAIDTPTPLDGPANGSGGLPIIGGGGLHH